MLRKHMQFDIDAPDLLPLALGVDRPRFLSCADAQTIAPIQRRVSAVQMRGLIRDRLPHRTRATDVERHTMLGNEPMSRICV